MLIFYKLRMSVKTVWFLIVPQWALEGAALLKTSKHKIRGSDDLFVFHDWFQWARPVYTQNHRLFWRVCLLLCNQIIGDFF